MATSVRLTATLSGGLAVSTDLNLLRSTRAMLEREIADAMQLGLRTAVSLAPPPRRVLRFTPEPKRWRLRIKNGIRLRKTNSALEGVLVSSYPGSSAGGGKPAAVNQFMEFGTGRRGGSKWAGWSQGIALPSWYHYGSKAGQYPSPFMGPAYLAVMHQLKERVARGMARMAQGWR